ncbi:acyltransferase [Sandaracinobacter sp. RS1-74]|uniref:acyltransferase family protein n=1 Tax=Sandaracinobacteroides sayramensis TaxID=2913411 RepID=UPI001EDA1755|nr:acyltransferase [Sandaracinobacteroides sayramensis]MCG2840219.1 acyltransferase [Sandaracinobacteroides sayramensis]
MIFASNSAGQSDGHYRALDSLRGIAAILVCLYHFKVNSHLAGFAIVRNAWMFVDFFFVLSGFVICLAYARRLGQGKPGEFKAFAIRRFGRIYPLHLVMLLLFLAFELLTLAMPGLRSGPAFGEGKSIGDFGLTLFLLNCFGLADNLKWNTPSWSIAAEWWTYLAFAAAAVLAGRRLPLALSAMAAIGLAVMVANLPSMYAVYDYGFWRCLLGFSAGALVATGWSFLEPQLRRFSNLVWHGIETILLLAVIWMVSELAHSGWSFLSPLLFAACVAAVAVERGWVSRLLLAAPLLFAGKISYGIYMVQALIIARFENLLTLGERALGIALKGPATFAEAGSERMVAGASFWQGDLMTVLLLAMVLIAATLSYHFIEEPGKRWAARLADKARHRPAEAS